MRFNLNPVYLKELKVRARSMRLAVAVLCYNGLLAVVGILILFLSIQSGGAENGHRYEMITSVFMVMGGMEFCMVLFAVPAFTAGAVSGERERQTLDLLLVSRLRPVQIVWGKLLSSISMILFLILSSMPVLSLVFTVGGIGIKDMLMLVLLYIVTAVFIGSIGIFCSSLFKRTIPSTVLTYGILIFLTLGTTLVIGITYLALESRLMNTGAVADIGNVLSLLLLNPIFTMISLVSPRYGGVGGLAGLLGNFGTPDPFLLNYWFWLSSGVQLVLAAIFLLLAAWRLSPARRRRVEKKNRNWNP